jgi:hypothetical protein
MRFDLVLAPRGRILPATERDAERIKAHVRPGELMPVHIRKPRDGTAHRRFMTMCRFIAENHDRFADEDDVLRELKIRTGHVREYITSKGEVFYELRSISYEDMEQADFDEFAKKAMRVACSELIPDIPDWTVSAYLDKLLKFG